MALLTATAATIRHTSPAAGSLICVSVPILKVAKPLGVGVSTVQRVKAEMPAVPLPRQRFSPSTQSGGRAAAAATAGFDPKRTFGAPADLWRRVDIPRVGVGHRHRAEWSVIMARVFSRSRFERARKSSCVTISTSSAASWSSARRSWLRSVLAPLATAWNTFLHLARIDANQSCGRWQRRSSCPTNFSHGGTATPPAPNSPPVSLLGLGRGTTQCRRRATDRSLPPPVHSGPAPSTMPRRDG
jgi:hypothetical protein